MHDYDYMIAPLISLLCMAIGLIVYLNNRKDSSGKVVAVISVTIGFWVLSAFLSDVTKNELLSLFLNRFIFVALISFIGGLFYLPFVFPMRSKIANTIKIFIIVFSVMFGLITLFTPLIVSSIQFESWGSNITYGKLFMLFTGYTVIVLLVLLTKFIISYIKIKSHTEREKIRLFFTGLILVTVINVIVQVVIRNIVGSDEYYRFGNYSVIIFVGYTAYAIIKHQLFNIKVILTEVGVAIVNIAILEQIFLPRNSWQVFINVILLLIVAYGSYVLVKSVIWEIKQKEELQKLSTDLAHANEHLKELDKMKTEFVSLASHELLTPVSAIEGYLSMMLDEHLAKVDDPTAARYLDRIYRSSKRLARLISDMLNISRIEEGRLLVEKKDIDLSELIKQVIDEIKFKAEEMKQTVIFDNGKSEALNPKSETISNDQKEAKWMTYGDPDKIKEVIVNLIGNSIKYSANPGEIKVIVKKVPTVVVQSTWQKIEDDIKERPLDDQEAITSAVNPHFKEIVGPEQLLISVKDQGIGIPRDELPRLFKKFHRVGDYSTAESQGTGLGLYISRALVELHHGRIWADSEGPSKGSTFTFSLPDISDKQQIIDLEKQVPQDKEKLKPLAKPMKADINDKFENFPITDEKLKEENHKN